MGFAGDSAYDIRVADALGSGAHGGVEGRGGDREPPSVPSSLAAAAGELRDGVRSVLETALITERQDMVRIWHPTLPVLRFWREVLTKADDPTIHELREYFIRYVYNAMGEKDGDENENPLRVRVGWVEANEIGVKKGEDEDEKGDKAMVKRGNMEIPGSYLRTLRTNAPPPWALPFELAIAVHAARRPEKAVRALSGTLQNLLGEQAELLSKLEHVITRVTNAAHNVQVDLNTLHEACMGLYSQ
ncbi:unnamed protein product [Phytomonas sp. EM1]|nr:unnamed protein product [Phytomonas sp. EM1]|eukprot:CCW63112.1 unnamed protein product [Phytomonas sp. isolate EM1]